MRKKTIVLTAMAVTVMYAATLALAGCNTHSHTLEFIAEEKATCTEAGHEAYYKCTDPECGKLFSDAEGKTEISAVPTINATGHNMTKHNGTPATCTTDGTAEYYTCANEAETVYYANEQGTEKITDLAVKATGHKMTKHDAKSPTCEAEGNKTYWTCEYEDGVYYADEEGNNTTTLEDITVAQKVHTVVSVEEVPATCVSDGVRAHFTCYNCGKLYSDAAGQTEVEKDSLIIPKNQNHTGELTFNYDTAPEAVERGGTLKATCSECKQEVEISYDEGTVASTDKTQPYEISNGKTIYAMFNENEDPNCWVGVIIKNPGTYTFSFKMVHKGTATTKGYINILCFSRGKYATMPVGMMGAVIASGKWATGMSELAQTFKDRILMNGQLYDPENRPEDSMTVSFTVEQSDLTSGALYVSIDYLISIKNGDLRSSVLFSLTADGTDNMGDETDNMRNVRLEQVALLPSKDNE